MSQKTYSQPVNADQLVKNIQNLIDWGKKNLHNFNENDISDGYHSFNELYEFRKMYNAALFNEWAKQNKHDVHKSIRHHDGELCFGGGWFIVVAMLPTGQISNHYKMRDWDLFKVPVTQTAKYPFDGHTGKDVLNRLKEILT